MKLRSCHKTDDRDFYHVLGGVHMSLGDETVGCRALMDEVLIVLGTRGFIQVMRAPRVSSIRSSSGNGKKSCECLKPRGDRRPKVGSSPRR